MNSKLSDQQRARISWMKGRYEIDDAGLDRLAWIHFLRGDIKTTADPISSVDIDERQATFLHPDSATPPVTEWPTDLMGSVLAESDPRKIYNNFGVSVFELAKLYADRGGKPVLQTNFLTLNEVLVLSRNVGTGRLAHRFQTSSEEIERVRSRFIPIYKRLQESWGLDWSELDDKTEAVHLAWLGVKGVADHFGVSEAEVAEVTSARFSRSKSANRNRTVSLQDRTGVSDPSWQSTDVEIVRELHARGLSESDLAIVYGVGVVTVKAALQGRATDLQCEWLFGDTAHCNRPQSTTGGQSEESLTSHGTPSMGWGMGSPPIEGGTEAQGSDSGSGHGFQSLRSDEVDALLQRHGVDAIAKRYGVEARDVYERLSAISGAGADAAADSEGSERDQGLDTTAGADARCEGGPSKSLWGSIKEAFGRQARHSVNLNREAR